MDLREQACWLLLVFESGLSLRIVNAIVALWCKQGGRKLEDFFAADPHEWIATCHLKTDIVQKLERAKEKLPSQSFLAEQLEHDQVRLITVLDDEYPALLKAALDINRIPPLLFALGDLEILKRTTIAIIGSRNATEESLEFTSAVAQFLAEQGANVISGNARGVDRSAYEGATGVDGYTTVVLPHGIRKLSRAQMRVLRPKIETGKVLLLSQFHPDAPWLVSRAMERNMVVTGLAQIVIVAEADSKGGTWEGAHGALKQRRPLYVREAGSAEILPGNKLLLEKGARALPWPAEDVTRTFMPLLHVSASERAKQMQASPPSYQPSLFIQ